jgi:hypothetical protein
MSKCGLALVCDLPQTKGNCMFRLPNAFINTPASYLLETPVPHGTLDEIHIHLNWTSTNILFFSLRKTQYTIVLNLLFFSFHILESFKSYG